MGQGRLLMHLGGDPVWNMAMDQAIAEAIGEEVIRGGSPTQTLRIYTWKAPTLSLGYFQQVEDSEPRFASVRRVRRSTGGGAILHDMELTYSLTMGSPPSERGARPSLYSGVHEAILKSLADFGVHAKAYRDEPQDSATAEKAFLCFHRRTDDDLIVHGYKVAGSAQRRHRGAILQHGSILLEASTVAQELPGLRELTSRQISVERLAECLVNHVGSFADVVFEPATTTSWEQQRSQLIEQSRFASADWFNRR
ncbi:MAG: lipoate--protein ligase family protein [Planctomycetota bacterium]